MKASEARKITDLAIEQQRMKDERMVRMMPLITSKTKQAAEKGKSCATLQDIKSPEDLVAVVHLLNELDYDVAHSHQTVSWSW
jgi:hypothetical protein